MGYLTICMTPQIRTSSRRRSDGYDKPDIDLLHSSVICRLLALIDIARTSKCRDVIFENSLEELFLR